MRHVHLHVDDRIALDVAHLRGAMIGRVPRKPPVFDDQQSFVIELADASISMDMGGLTNLMNDHVLNYDGAPLRKLSVQAAGDRLQIEGTLKKGVNVHFSSKASVTATREGALRIHIESMKAAGVPVKGLMDLLGLKLDDIADLKNRRGVDVQDNDIVIQPGQVLPPPEIRGPLAHATVENNRLVMAYGSGRKPAPLTPPDPRAKNYIYFAHGEITFGKLTMHDTDLQLIDLDDKDPFDFYPAKYNAQLVAGYSKNTPRLGLKTFMPDYGDLRSAPPAAPPSTPAAPRRSSN